MNAVNDMYIEFQTALDSIMNSHIPTKIIYKRNQTTWISRRIKRLHNRKHRAFNSNKQRTNQTSCDFFVKHVRPHTKRQEPYIEGISSLFVLTRLNDSGLTSKALKLIQSSPKTTG